MFCCDLGRLYYGSKIWWEFAIQFGRYHDDGLDGALLDGRGLLEAVGVNAPEEVLVETHFVEGRQHRHFSGLGELDPSGRIGLCGRNKK